METKSRLMEPLLQQAEAYGRTSVELIKLKAADKTADLASTFISRTLFTIMAVFFTLLINIAVALWLGELMGRMYYGFLVVAGCYALAGIILLMIHPFIKSRVQNAVIRQLFN